MRGKGSGMFIIVFAVANILWIYDPDISILSFEPSRDFFKAVGVVGGMNV